MVEKIRAILAATTILMSIMLFYGWGSLQDILLMALALSPILVLTILMFYKKIKFPRRIDEQLVSLTLHMYVVSLGEVSPGDLVRIVAETRDYRYYSRIFARILDLAKRFGYGFIRATAKIAAATKPPLRDVLVRCQHVFSSISPRSYLEIEASMMMEEHSGYYERAVKAIEVFGGIYSALQSIAIFILMVVVLMVIFTNAPGAVYYAYALTPLMLIVMLIAFKVTAPMERLVYIDGYVRPRLYRVFRFSIIALPACTLISFIVGLSASIPFMFASIGLGALAPGLIAYLFERIVYKIDENYPTLIKSLGESMSSTSNLKSALYYALYLKLGPLKRLIKRAYARFKVGVRNEEVMRLFSAEAASYKIYPN
ncbi:MAG: hypothetical protein QXR13_01195 [Candidatus Bathyarchaeia archaeon]